jgi:hypothetical protein
MLMKTLFTLTLALGIYYAALAPVYAQAQATEQPTAEELEKEKAEREKNAYRLLEQVIDEAQSLRLTENRVRVQITAADLLWDNNQGRARSLFAMAAEGVAELGRTPPPNNRRGGPPNPDRRSFQLRQELVLAAARHDAQLAYQLLASTKPPVQTVTTDQRGPRPQFSAEDNLEQTLLGRIAALDPKLAAQNAEQMMDKGQFPRTVFEVLNQLHRQDPEAAAKLGDKTVKKLQTANLLTNNEAANLAQSLLTAGPRPPQNVTAPPISGRAPVLEQSAYVELLGSVVDLALKVVPAPAQGNPRRAGAPVRSGVAALGPGQSNQGQPSEAQIEMNAARRLLAGLLASLPLIDQYLPAKSALVRQKFSEVGLPTTSQLNVTDTFRALQGNPTSDALVQAAAMAPPQVQPRLYQQAAVKALEEGNTDRARQIATNHLQPNARDNLMQRIAFTEMAKKGEGADLDEIRQMIARLESDEQKIDALIAMARDTQKINSKLAGQFLDEARQITNRRATNYEHFEQQLKVARAFATIDPARSFDVLDPGISQLNELLAAAAVLNGFEVNMFRDGEMAFQGGGGLTGMINRFGQELGFLAHRDLERAETLAGRFQLAEPRIMARLAIVRGLFERTTAPGPSRVAFE